LGLAIIKRSGRLRPTGRHPCFKHGAAPGKGGGAGAATVCVLPGRSGGGAGCRSQCRTNTARQIGVTLLDRSADVDSFGVSPSAPAPLAEVPVEGPRPRRWVAEPTLESQR